MKAIQEIMTMDTTILPIVFPILSLNNRSANGRLRIEQHKAKTQDDVTAILGGVYMRKLAPARVLHWDDFLISYRVYMMTGSFHILLFNGTFHVDELHV